MCLYGGKDTNNGGNVCKCYTLNSKMKFSSKHKKELKYTFSAICKKIFFSESDIFAIICSCITQIYACEISV